ncbi:DUF2868 domain-containing protein [Methylibium petroleiphilum]|uniref:DUF2868 domain-containing protein n=1 Tax=Methylibium petroleiphilum TaxID=105560 RepID=UPI001ACCF07E|nr:DUF2868 domain-containing protein [Methylibium petroleiphilum]MBN9203096.1 DUF2868 domain-containing protein [Methylibium petroleiphilum]
MNADDARRVLLVRSFETPMTLPWTAADAAWASEQAARAAGERAEASVLIAQRAGLAIARLTEREPAVRAVLAATTWPGWLGSAVVALALLAGAASDAIGPSQRINILAPPLLALLVWNLVVYAVLALHRLRPAGAPQADAGGPIRRALTRWLERAGTRATRSAPAAPTLRRFASAWAEASAALHGARIAAVLHAAAAAFAIGALAALYLRGIAFEYRAGWDSTFLTAQHVQQWLGLVLGPASALSGLALPDAAQLASLRFSVGPGGNAARWIHLHALTIALAVLLPRTALALSAAWRARRLARHLPLPLDEPYYQRLLPVRDGERRTVQVLPYSYALPPALQPALRAALESGLGPRLDLRVNDSVPLGGEDELATLSLPPSPGAVVVALFALTATPERETHGAFVQALAARAPAGQQLVVLVDESGFRARFNGADGAARHGQRRAAWRQMLGELGRTPVFVDLSAPDLQALEADKGLQA